MSDTEKKEKKVEVKEEKLKQVLKWM